MDAAIKVENLSKRYQIGKKLKKYLNFQEQLTDLVTGPFKRQGSKLALDSEPRARRRVRSDAIKLKNVRG